MKEHTMLRDFPAMSEKIHEIKKSNRHFAGLSDKYDEMEHKIHRIESGAEAFTDEHLEDLKKSRLKLKDELFTILQKAV